MKKYDNILSKAYESKEIISEQGILTGEVSLLPIQKWFFDNKYPIPHHWNQSFMLKIESLSINKLELAVYNLQKQHDVFRLRYKNNKQYYDAEVPEIKLKTLDICTADIEKTLNSWQSSFNLEEGPLHCIAYLHGYEDRSARIFFAMHHLILDSVSWRILAEDLEALYNDQELNLKGSSYRQWSVAIAEYAHKNKSEHAYWKNILIDFDKDGMSTIIQDREIINHGDLSLTSKQTTQLLKISNQAYNTQINDLLLTALAYALAKITDKNVNHIILEGHGREEIDERLDINRTVGWFTTMFPVRLKLCEHMEDSIKFTKEYLRQVPNNGIGYGALFGYKKDELPKISFNYLGQFGNEKNDKPWSIVKENTGQSFDELNKSDLLLNINGGFVNGILHFDILSKLDIKVSNKFIKAFKYYLEEVISHCINKKTTSYTMSDFDDFEPYVILNDNINYTNINNNLFMFPPGDGGAESYFNNVVTNLADFRLVLFNNYYYHLKENYSDTYNVNEITYEELAKEYITYMESIQPFGPYNLFGWSFGGVLVFEIAKQLAKKGQIVKNIILLDPYFNYKVVCKAIKNLTTDLINNINEKYSPQATAALFDTNILLFKATKEEHGILSLTDISKHYVENTESNYLDTILKEKEISIIPLNTSHYNVMKNDDCIEKICYFINKLMLSDTNTFSI